MKKINLFINLVALFAVFTLSTSEISAGCPCKGKGKDKESSFEFTNKLPIEDEQYIDEVSDVSLLACDCGHEDQQENLG